jgi:two-component system, cell cycle sensor histidine kinase and response regulator CckA
VATPKVLIVDDQAVMRDVIVATLEPLGYELRTVADPQEVVRVATEWDADLVLLDVMMPGMSGIEVCQLLRENPFTQSVPIVMVTALTDRQILLDALAAGADDFLTKPIDPVELRARVQSICRLNRYRQLLHERARVAALLDRASIATWYLDEAGNVLHANPLASRVLGLSPSQVSDGSAAMPSGPFRAALIASGSQARLKARPVALDTAGLGVRDFDECIVSASFLADRPAVRVDAISRALAEDVERNFRHRERLAMLGQLSASAAHELASVLTIIDVTAQQPMATAGSWEAATSRIRTATVRGGRLVRALLSWSRPTRADLAQTSVRAVEEEILPGIRVLLSDAADVEFDADTVADIPLGRADLEQVLLNLCVNARDAGADVIRVQLRDRGPDIEMVVADNGRGIPPGMRGLVGEAFVSSKGMEGHGLGVWTVRRILEAARGSLAYREGEVSGTRAIVHIMKRVQ